MAELASRRPNGLVQIPAVGLGLAFDRITEKIETRRMEALAVLVNCVRLLLNRLEREVPD